MIIITDIRKHSYLKSSIKIKHATQMYCVWTEQSGCIINQFNLLENQIRNSWNHRITA